MSTPRTPPRRTISAPVDEPKAIAMDSRVGAGIAVPLAAPLADTEPPVDDTEERAVMSRDHWRVIEGKPIVPWVKIGTPGSVVVRVPKSQR